MSDQFLYESLDASFELGLWRAQTPDDVTANLNPNLQLRPYQAAALARFLHCFHKPFPGKERPLHLLFNMATGSGKTLLMAGLMLYLFQHGYRNFLFFVNAANIIEKTKDNFLNPSSSKFLFKRNIQFGGQPVKVAAVDNFQDANANDINICFTTIQKMHADLTAEKENAVTYADFKGKPIVLLADEAHHMNAATKKQRDLEELNWEATVRGIFAQHKNNLLLEFTATLDYAHAKLAEKYRNKVIYRYDLRQFRDDGYSKDVYIVQSDFAEQQRILQALVISQYKREVAAKNRINLKPVILFKAQKTIAQSHANKRAFHQLIENLSAHEIARLRAQSNIPLVKAAFQFFASRQISVPQLTDTLRQEFDESRCLSVNEAQEKEDQQIILNTLEENNNPIRAVFTVQKLNEGWDVLNLFDIVRCYSAPSLNHGKPGKTTISEAQLIGRGARYFPFSVAGAQNKNRFVRKFDHDAACEMRILEQLHYHSINDSGYISELRTALIARGMLAERQVTKSPAMKNCFKQTAQAECAQRGLIYRKARVKNDYQPLQSFADMGVARRNYRHRIAGGRGRVGALLNADEEPNQIAATAQQDIKVKEMPRHIVQNAVSQNPFFAFDTLQRHFPHVTSVRKMIAAEEYLGGLEITFCGAPNELENLSNQDQLSAVSGLLKELELQIRNGNAEPRSAEPRSTEHKPKRVAAVFSDKNLPRTKSTKDTKDTKHSRNTNNDANFIATMRAPTGHAQRVEWLAKR